LLGLLLVGIEKSAGAVFPVPLTAALMVAVLAAVTRGLHLDGFMDVCDGLFGGYTPQRRLEILRDSHVGAFAVVGGVCLLILKYGALVSLLSLSVPGREWVLLLVPALSRWSMVLQLGLFPYARREGLGSPLHQGTARLATSVAAATAIAASVVLGGIGGSGLLVGSTVLAWLLGLGMSRMLGGLTGDAYGATNEVIEVVGLVTAAALLPAGWIQPLWEILG
jgi:adenosylcobinamide-GDP ribazoletransferase